MASMENRTRTAGQSDLSSGERAITGIFPEFSFVDKFGYYVWDKGQDSNKQLKSFVDVTKEDILHRLRCDEGGISTEGTSDDDELENCFQSLSIGIGAPPTLDYSNVRFPVRIQNLPPQEFPNRFPNDPGYIVPLYVALKKGASLSQIDFVLGGSALDVLANREIDGSDTKYLVQRVRNVIFFCKSKEYVQDYAVAGFQFERLVTGERPEDNHHVQHYENLHLMKIGGFNVLLSAEVDAVDDDGNPAEIKSGNPKYFGSRLVFQMISSGAQTLVHADKQRGAFNSVNEKSISSVIEDYIGDHRVAAKLQRNIIQGLTYLNEQSSVISESSPSEVKFSRTTITLSLPSNRKANLLPKKDVVDELIELAESD